MQCRCLGDHWYLDRGVKYPDGTVRMDEWAVICDAGRVYRVVGYCRDVPLTYPPGPDRWGNWAYIRVFN